MKARDPRRDALHRPARGRGVGPGAGTTTWLGAAALACLCICACACRGRAPGGVRGGGDAGQRIRLPLELRAPGAPPSGLELDLPIAWMFLPEDPVPTGASPNVLVAAEMPCGYHAVYGTVSGPVSPLRVLLRGRYVGAGRPADARCAVRPVAVRYVSLQRLRLATYAVTDATPHEAASPAVPAPPAPPAGPAVVLHVVEDNADTPAPQRRRVRACTPGDDRTCTAGGACGTVPGRVGPGVCAPPLDPYRAVGRACPEGTREVALEHPGPWTLRAAPPAGGFAACLPGCDPAHPCAAPLECVTARPGDAAVCLPAP